MDQLLEVIVIPVSDVDRSLVHYRDVLGWHLDVDHRAGDDFRVVQLTPPGSACSVTFGVGLTDSEPGSHHGMHLVVTDVVAMRARLVGAGAAVGPVRHMGADGWEDGPHPDRADFGSFADLPDPDGNTFVLQERGHGG